MKGFLHRLLFLILVIPLGLLFIIELPLHMFIQSIRWIFFGKFSDEFIFKMFASKIIDFLRLDETIN